MIGAGSVVTKDIPLGGVMFVTVSPTKNRSKTQVNKMKL